MLSLPVARYFVPLSEVYSHAFSTYPLGGVAVRIAPWFEETVAVAAALLSADIVYVVCAPVASEPTT